MKKIDVVKICIAKTETTQYNDKNINNAEAVADVIRSLVGTSADEHFYVLVVDVKNKITCIQEGARGGPETVTFSPKDIFRAAILAGGSGIIVSHNHPSGDPSPSPEDKLLTIRLQECAKILGFRFLDHVVVGNEKKYYSFNESGIL